MTTGSADLRQDVRAADAKRILHAAIAAADPGRAVATALHELMELRHSERVHLIAVGKAAGAMAIAAIDSLPRPPLSALVIIPHDVDAGHIRSRAARALTLRVMHAAHPVPDASSVRAAMEIENQLASLERDDVVLVLISGGASSLCAAPYTTVGIDEYAATVSALMRAGADIRDLNTVRTHIDRLKGGGMAPLISPARAVALIVSDVPGNPVDVIASGPLSPSVTTPADALSVLERYTLLAEVPGSIRRVLASDRTSAHDFAHVTTRIVLDNRAAVLGAADEARRLGYDTRINDQPVTGSARAAGARLAAEALTHAGRMRRRDAPLCVLYGGETTVVVTGSGIGGRNQELALAAAIALDGDTRVTIGSVGTDGVDGPTNAAGAVADGRTVRMADRAGVSAGAALQENDSHRFFRTAGGLIVTGATGTNVMDVQVVLIDG